MIPRDVYDDLQPHFYDERHIKLYNKQFQFFVKKRLEELGYPPLIAEWTYNMDTAAYLKHPEKRVYIKHKRRNKSSVRQKIINMSSYSFYFKIF